jgi:ABC-type transport system substrate-binding protein
MDKLQIQVYSDEVAEYNAMLTTPSSALDLGDWPVPASDVAPFTADTRFYLSAANSEFGMFEFDFNHANTYWGTNDAHGNNAAGIEFRQAVAHLVNKPAVVLNLFGTLANAIDNPVPPGQGLLCSGLGCSSGPGPYTYLDSANGRTVSLTGACGWETIASLQSGCTSAFVQGGDTLDSVGLVTASAANPDFCDAAQHLVNAGLANGIAADCSVAGHHTAALDSGSITLWVRSDNPPRLAIGNDLAIRLCELFGGVGVTSCPQISVTRANILTAIGQVFNTKSVLLDWHIYTAAWGLTPIYDQIYALYNSAFASRECGGKAATFGQDYGYFCNAQFDAFSSMLEFNDTTSGSVASAQMAMQIFGQSVATIPLWSQALRVPYLKSFTGVSDASGLGPSQFYSTLNAWSPTPPTPATLRWGFKQGTVNLNIFLTTTQWEFYVYSNIYDSLIGSPPYNATVPFAYLASSYSSVVAINSGPTGPCPTGTAPCQCGNGDLFPVPGTQSCLIFNLRPNAFFHDGRVVTGSDVKFSMLAYKQIPGPLSAGVSGLIDVTYQAGPSPGANAVFAHLNSKSPFAPFSVGGEPIIPQHVWASDPTTSCPGSQTGTTLPLACTVNPNLTTADPVTSSVCVSATAGACGTGVTAGSLCATFVAPGCVGLFTGNGPWECANLNKAGTPASEGPTGNGCTATGTNTAGTQAVDVGGTIVLQRNGFGTPSYQDSTNYYRSSRDYKNWLWADRQGQGIVNFVDASNFGSCWGKTISSTLNTGCAHWANPSATISTTLCGTAGWPTADCNAGSQTNTKLGGNSPGCGSTTSCSLNTIESGQLGQLWQVAWTNPVAVNLLVAQAVPQTTYEGGLVYTGSAPP